MKDNSESQAPFWLDREPVYFPPTQLAMSDPNGLLAIGGDLTAEWLLHAYSIGLFPWFNPGEPILWWTPNPRSVLPIEQIKIRKSLLKKLKQQARSEEFAITLDQDFLGVITACSEVPREGQNGTWITDEMVLAYLKLHQKGYAHSVEVWLGKHLVGGLYGIAIGKMFYGESMFAKQTDASKMALIALAMQLKHWGFTTIDTQVETPHLNSLGAEQIARSKFEKIIHQQTNQDFPNRHWQFEIDWLQAAQEHYQTAHHHANEKR